jgi:mannitol/fructose-specific phosphotransferase system IIA component (Ntr-type)
MTLAEHLDERWVDPALRPDSRDHALRLIVEMLHAAGTLSEVEEPLDSLIAREKVMSTGIGRGVAVPHARSMAAARTVLSICRVPDGLDFHSLDGAPVELVFTLLGPPESAGLHVKLLGRIARLARHADFRREIRQATRPAEIIDLVAEHESDLHRRSGRSS